jgi:transposase-like protein
MTDRTWEGKRAAPHQLLPDPEVKEIWREFLVEGKSINQIARQHENINPERVKRIVANETYRHLPRPEFDLFGEPVPVPVWEIVEPVPL